MKNVNALFLITVLSTSFCDTCSSSLTIQTNLICSINILIFIYFSQNQ